MKDVFKTFLVFVLVVVGLVLFLIGGGIVAAWLNTINGWLPVLWIFILGGLIGGCIFRYLEND